MKKSKQIKLVLVTALLASCRTILPERQQPMAPDIPDSELTRRSVDTSAIAGEEYEEPGDSYNYTNGYFPCDFNFDFFSYWYYVPMPIYKRGSVVRSGHFFTRGGFGRSGSHAAS